MPQMFFACANAAQTHIPYAYEMHVLFKLYVGDLYRMHIIVCIDTQISYTLYHTAPFLRATNFVDFVDFGASTKFISPKISGNSIMALIVG